MVVASQVGQADPSAGLPWWLDFRLLLGVTDMDLPNAKEWKCGIAAIALGNVGSLHGLCSRFSQDSPCGILSAGRA